MNPITPYLSAKEAAARLGIRLETLYAYVSRGLVRSEKVGNSRASRYLREDIELLRRRREERKHPDRALEKALDFGGPVLDSAITLIDDGRFFYRGESAIEVARQRSLEEVAAWIWTGRWQGLDGAIGGAIGGGGGGRAEERWPGLSEDLARRVAERSAVERLQILLPSLAAEDIAAYDLRPSAVCRTGCRLLDWMTRIAAGRFESTGSWVETLARGWGCKGEKPRDLLRMALVLCVDHELNVSSFTARCVASAGASPYAVVLAGLAALQGVKHGGHTERVEALFREAGEPRHVRRVMAERLRRGEQIPGCGQPLYPQGDPRTRVLMERLEEQDPASPALHFAHAFTEAARELLDEHPTVDLGLTVVARALNLPQGSALTLFALGRSIGWIGHAIEQYETGQLIRPRARYVGTPPIDGQRG